MSTIAEIREALCRFEFSGRHSGCRPDYLVLSSAIDRLDAYFQMNLESERALSTALERVKVLEDALRKIDSTASVGSTPGAVDGWTALEAVSRISQPIQFCARAALAPSEPTKETK